MAKRHLDLNGAKAPKLELDYLRLLVAVRQLRQQGQDAAGYLLVMTSAIKRRAHAWASKYCAKDEVQVVVATLTPRRQRQVQAEVRANRIGMVEGSRGRPVRGRSDARMGGRLAERQLSAFIEKREPHVRKITDSKDLPLGIQWDYYGIIDLANGTTQGAP
jgi:hypothetical protein